MPGIKVTAIGGGTGLPIALKSIKEYASEVTAIVSVADDGGSSGRLRRDLGILPPGDIRNCLVALAGDRHMAELFKYRFKEGVGITGHNLGNLIIAALTDLRGGFDCGINAAAELLDIDGRVLPSTIDNVILRAATYAGDPIEGQVSIATTTRPLKEVYLDPPETQAYPAAVEAILEADQVIMGPGSVFTSILPNLIVNGIGKALSETNAIKIYICNVMTQPGETDLFTAYDHIGAILDHGPKDWVDVMIVNSKPVPEDRVIDYAEGRRYQVSANIEDIEALGINVIHADVLDEDKPSCHSSKKLAAILRELK
ncbi:MAG: uridine diphosphate-N-acetylglucosamine-binding protein YvcK [Candidatus Aquicultor sp.]|nr:uridine diphosphate-N-acetylglucosamine-binding protein YvcK [Candidatus Aquicultor sp.]